jgi:hypothetical protein
MTKRLTNQAQSISTQLFFKLFVTAHRPLFKKQVSLNGSFAPLYTELNDKRAASVHIKLQRMLLGILYTK